MTVELTTVAVASCRSCICYESIRQLTRYNQGEEYMSEQTKPGVVRSTFSIVERRQGDTPERREVDGV